MTTINGIDEIQTLPPLEDVTRKKDSSPQRFKQAHSEKHTTYIDALHAKGRTVLADGWRIRIRHRADDSFDLVTYEPTSK